MADLKDTWKDTAKGLGHAFRDLGKALVRTAKVGVKKVDEWANGDDENQSQSAQTDTEKENKAEQ